MIWYPFDSEVPPFNSNFKSQLLKAVEAMHDPVVFFDQGRIDAFLLRNDADQSGEIRG